MGRIDYKIKNSIIKNEDRILIVQPVGSGEIKKVCANETSALDARNESFDDGFVPGAEIKRVVCAKGGIVRTVKMKVVSRKSRGKHVRGRNNEYSQKVRLTPINDSR